MSGAWVITGFALWEMCFALLTDSYGEDNSQKPGREEN